MIKIKYISWRDGRPRFNPGTSLRKTGYRGQDLRHDNGEWFNAEECRAYSGSLVETIGARRTNARFSKPAAAAEPKKASNKRGFVYFLRSAERIKIGFSAKPATRLRTLNTGVSHGVETVVIVPGTEREERSLHHQLRRHRRNGEWFEAHPIVVEAMIRSLMFRKVALNTENGSGSSVAPCDKCDTAANLSTE